MKEYIFSGVVDPERASFWLRPGVTMVAFDAAGVESTRMRFELQLGQLTAHVRSDEPDLLTLRNEVLSNAEVLTSAAGFLLGHSYSVEVTKTYDVATGESTVFGIDIPILSSRAVGRDIAVGDIFPLLGGTYGVYLTRCLTDLSLAIRKAVDTGFYCFRAIESLRQSFANGQSEADQWKALASALGKDETAKEELALLRKHAFPARHGIPNSITSEERGQIFLYAWDVVEKYMDFRLEELGHAPRFGTRKPKSITESSSASQPLGSVTPPSE